MGNPQKLGNFVNALFQDASNNVGIGGSPSGSYKLEVTGSDILVNGIRIGKGASSIASNTAIGLSALPVNTTGTFNTAIGNYALLTNTTGYGNTSVGYSAIGYNTTGFYNAAIGVNALLSNTTGTYNNALGTAALYANTTGSYNTAVGQQAGTANTTGSNNTYIGYASGFSITTGSNNTIIGAYYGTAAMANNIVLADGAGTVRYQWDGTNNVFGNPLSGTSATFSGNLEVFSGSAGVTVGDFLVNPTTKYVYVGRQSSTSGDNTTFVVRDRTGSARATIPGGGSIDTVFSTNSSNFIVTNYSGTSLMTIANTGTATFSSSVAVGDSVSLLGELYWGGISSGQKVRAYTTGASGSATLNFSFWNGSAWVIQGNLTSAGVWSTTGGGTSDARTKDEIDYNFDNGIESILKLQPTKFKFKNAPNKQRRGFIAQDVLTTIPDLVLGDGEKENGTYGLDYDGILALAVKAIQEQQAQIQNLQEQNQDLKSRLDKAGL